MIEKTPHIVVGPFSQAQALRIEAIVLNKFAPVAVEITGGERHWVLLHWPKSVPDKETQTKIIGFCHGIAAAV